MELWTAALMGLGGSLHCVGMCGPLALALAGGQNRRLAFVVGRLLYNGGRLVTYALLGGLFGLLGGALHIADWQQDLSIGLGAVIILVAVMGMTHRHLPLASLPAQGVAAIKRGLGRLLRLQSMAGLFFVGVLNGLLPCGFVYLALAGSLTTASPAAGMAYMALFGVGTVPLMLATSLFGRLFVRPSLQLYAQRAMPVGMLLLGTLFVLRGLGLGIAYVSPMLHAAGGGHGH
jgi:uncharacterized protein